MAPGGLAIRIADAGFYDAALAVSDAIADSFLRDDSRSAIARCCAPDMTTALKTADGIQSSTMRPDRLIHIIGKV